MTNTFFSHTEKWNMTQQQLQKRVSSYQLKFLHEHIFVWSTNFVTLNIQNNNENKIVLQRNNIFTNIFQTIKHVLDFEWQRKK